MSAITPGPWKVSEKRANGTKAYVDGPLGYVVAQAYCSPSVKVKYYDLWAEAEANARLIAAAPQMFEALEEGRRAIGAHFAPDDCYATGPLTGDSFRDLVECPACSFIGMYEAVMGKLSPSLSNDRQSVGGEADV